MRKPIGSGDRQPLKLEEAASHLLEECRMVLPGIQALFGFQLIAVFNQGFGEKLTGPQQVLHFVALLLVATAAALVMAPAAVHRQTGPREVTERFLWLSSVLVMSSMVPLALGLTLDVYVIAQIVLADTVFAAIAAAGLLMILLTLWFVLPQRERARRARRPPCATST